MCCSPGPRARNGNLGLLLEESARLIHVNRAAFVSVQLVEHLSNLHRCVAAVGATRTVHAPGGREHFGRTSISNFGESSGSSNPRHLMTGAMHPMLTGGRSTGRSRVSATFRVRGSAPAANFSHFA